MFDGNSARKEHGFFGEITLYRFVARNSLYPECERGKRIIVRTGMIRSCGKTLERPSDLLLNYFLHDEIEEVLPLVPKIRQVILEQETDTLVLVKLKNGKKFILHWEFETKK